MSRYGNATIHTTPDRGFKRIGYTTKQQMALRGEVAGLRKHESALGNPAEDAISGRVDWHSGITMISMGDLVLKARIPNPTARPSGRQERKGAFRAPREYLPLKQAVTEGYRSSGQMSETSTQGKPVGFSVLNGLHKDAILEVLGVAVHDWRWSADTAGDPTVGDRAVVVTLSGDATMFFTGTHCRYGDYLFVEMPSERLPVVPGDQWYPNMVAISPSNLKKDARLFLAKMYFFYRRLFVPGRNGRLPFTFLQLAQGKHKMTRDRRDTWASSTMRRFVADMGPDLTPAMDDAQITELKNDQGAPYAGVGEPIWPFLDALKNNFVRMCDEVRTPVPEEPRQLAYILLNHALLEAVPKIRGSVSDAQAKAFENEIWHLYSTAMIEIAHQCLDLQSCAYIGKALHDRTGHGPLYVALGTN